MASMAVHPAHEYEGERRPFPRQRSFPNRPPPPQQQHPYSPHARPPPPPGASHPPNRSPTAASPADPRHLYSVNETPPVHHASTFPIAPRWDSLSSGNKTPTRSPTSPNYPPSQGYPHERQSRSRGRPPPSSQRRDAQGYMSEPRSEPGSRSSSRPPSRPLTSKSSHGDMRSYEPRANFSRPRKQSLRQPPPEPLNLQPIYYGQPNDGHSDAYSHASPRTPSWQRSRGVSLSSSKASSIYGPVPSTMHRDASEPPMPRMRNMTGPPPPSATRPPLGYMRSDSSNSATGLGSPPPWTGGDELRTSFRSQMSASTGPVTAATERSSVMTKDSSVTSLEPNPDEPSLEDVMGMYEEGFGDHEPSGDEMRQEDNTDSRPTTAYSTVSLRSSFKPKSTETDIPAVPPLPKPKMPSALDNEIRQSKLFFTSPAFMSALPHLAGKDDDDEDDFKTPSRHDSGKSIDSSHSTPSEDNASSETSSPAMTPVDQRQGLPDASTRRVVYREDDQNFPTSTFTPAEPEAPGARDRYGFKKENQYISRKQYDKWETGYSEYLDRRKRKWVAYLKENALMTDRPNRFPPPTAKTKKFVRKGIPPDWRGAAWFYYAGGPAILAKHSGLYEKLLHKKARRVDVEAIERDLHRTFPDNIEFKPPRGYPTISPNQGLPSGGSSSQSENEDEAAEEEEPPIIASLRRVLFAFSIYNPNIGYCQSLNFIAGLLLLFVDTEEQCFWLLNVITHIYLPGTHDISLEGSKVDLSVLMSELRETMPSVWNKIGGELEGDKVSRLQASRSLRKVNPLKRDQQLVSAEKLPPITLCMTAWFMSCFIGTLPIETTLRVWDVFFYEGSKTLFRVAMAIFKLGEGEIKAVKDPMEIFGVVQSMPRKMIDANGVIEACFKRRNGFSHLSQGVIDERRQERREHASQERQKHASSGKSPTSGNVTEGESEIRRKGTLFGRKKKNRELSRTRTIDS